MASENSQCLATTKGGDQCRNRAVEGSTLCAIHSRAAARVEQPASTARLPAPVPSQPAPAEGEPVVVLPAETVAAVAEEFNKAAAEVKQKDPKFTPPPFSPESLKKVLKYNLDTLAAFMPIELARDILRNLEGTKPSDLLDPDTWKGLWYILHYTAERQAVELGEELMRRINAIPGMDMVTMLGQSIYESPGDLLDVETWKGAAVILNAAVTANLSSFKRRVLGQSDE
ncbi:MAG: hypothetical protein ACRC1H_13240 [Caldilineaceae bacterium]